MREKTIVRKVLNRLYKMTIHITKLDGNDKLRDKQFFLDRSSK